MTETAPPAVADIADVPGSTPDVGSIEPVPPADAAGVSADGHTDQTPGGHPPDGKPAPRKRSRVLYTLTSMRLFASATVLVLHYFKLGRNADEAVHGGRPVRAWLAENLPLFFEAGRAVDLFYLLSGFVLSCAYFEKWKAGRLDYGDFLFKRLARIYPLHFLTFAAFAAIWVGALLVGADSVAEAGRYRLPAVFTNIFLVHSWGFDPTLSFNAPSWSIAATWAGYLLFPATLWVMTRVPTWAAVVLSCAWFFGVQEFSQSLPDGLTLKYRNANFGVLRLLAHMPLGLSMFLVYRDWTLGKFGGEGNGDGRRRSYAAGIVLFTLGLAGMAWGMQVVWPHWSVSGCAAALILGAAIAEASGGLKWLRWRPLVWGGEISFSIYLLHMPIFSLVTKPAMKLLGVERASWAFEGLALVAAVVTLVVSHVMFVKFETPVRNVLVKWWTNRKTAEPSIPPAAP